ncbi:MAG: nicotinate (nicotinamide) nucleotide adenylyltransferase [Bdellovibrionales bacterium]|nr:nicotinate (nicotinamide) nucleotide adenylyltransferase [Bdellovibrionales bacterium]
MIDASLSLSNTPDHVRFEGASLPRFEHEPLLETFDGLDGKIGIFGLSADPIQNGHIALALQAKEELGLDCVVFMPAKRNPLKSHSTFASDNDRLEMIRGALKEHPDLYVCPIELNRDGKIVSYTVDSIKTIRSQAAPSAHLTLLMGEDTLMTLPKWKAIQTLIGLVDQFSVAARGSFPQTAYEDLRSSLGDEAYAKVTAHLFPPPGKALSSTAVRAAFARGETPSDSLPPSVLQYILEHGLYRP